MGPINSPPKPIAMRERDLRPLGGKEHGVEVLGTGQVYWAPSVAEAIAKAEADGHKL